MQMKYFEEDSIDDIMNNVINELIHNGKPVSASRGSFRELLAPTIFLRNPRARISKSLSRGKIFSGLGELIWYWSGSNNLELIDYYLKDVYTKESEDGITVNSGYGERLFNYQINPNENKINQIQNIIDLLKTSPTSRKAVIQLYSAKDLSEKRKSVPCTCTLQFLIRDERLNLLVNMRSNDVFLGLPHDIFVFTMIQEILARELSVEVGFYQHCAGSLHLYDSHKDKAQQYLDEGFFPYDPMPEMPHGSQERSLKAFLRFAEDVRENGNRTDSQIPKCSYWGDLCRLILVFAIYNKDKDHAGALAYRDLMENDFYKVFIEDRALLD